MNLHDKPEAGCRSTATFAALLVQHRKRDGRSQLALSLDIGISSRHLGFLETGRAQPSPKMVARLVEAFALGPIEASQMSLAAGHAPPASMQPEAASVLVTALGMAAFEAGIAIAGADTIEDAQRTAARFLLSLGVEHHMTGTLRRGPAGWEIQRDPGGNPAIGWLRHNELNGYRDQDYLVRATASANRAFFWSDARRERLSQVERRILDEAEDFRITNGFVMPLHMSDGSVRALSSWAQKIDTDNATRLALGLVASALIERIVALDMPRAATERAGPPRDAPPRDSRLRGRGSLGRRDRSTSGPDRRGSLPTPRRRGYIHGLRHARFGGMPSGSARTPIAARLRFNGRAER